MSSQRAVLIGAAALTVAAVAVGVSWTDATWADTETGTATFRAAVFQTQSQAAGSSEWADHPIGSPAELFLDQVELAPGGTRLAPAAGPSIYSWINLRTSAGTDDPARAQLTGLTADGDLAPAVDLRVVARTASQDACTAADFTDSATYLAGTATSYAHATGGAYGDASVRLGAHGTDPAGLCVELRLAQGAPDSFQGESARLTWSFTVTQAPEEP